MPILIDNGHGIQTKGKCSPDDQLLEYVYTGSIGEQKWRFTHGTWFSEAIGEQKWRFTHGTKVPGSIGEQKWRFTHGTWFSEAIGEQKG